MYVSASVFMVTVFSAIMLPMAYAKSNSELHCEMPREDFGFQKINGHFPGIYLASANLPRVVNQDAKQKCVVNDPRTAGANIVIPWSKIDRGQLDARGERIYDWSYVDQSTQAWRARGQKVNLLLWGAAQRTFQHIDGERATPEYVLENAPVVRCLRFEDEHGHPKHDPLDVDVPIHYHPEYLKHYKPMIEAFIRRFENEPWVNYMRVGIGVGAESYPANGANGINGPCRDEWEAAGFTAQIWRAHVLAMIDFIGTLSPKKAFVITLNDIAPDLEMASLAAKKAVEEYGFGIGTQGATARAILQYEQGLHGGRCYANWCHLFEKYKDKGVVLEIQTPNQSYPIGWENTGVNTQGHTGPLPQVLAFALERGVTSVEIYPFEWQVANGNEAYWAPYKSDYNKALTRSALYLQKPKQK
ncbi:hypothetical protein PN836_013760 [Ningiella sp. W23]|uniref:hypothetical protein n=1 Tax=Ningiella sp. W23 TaxID=3023715 RepID=UPI00375794CA